LLTKLYIKLTSCRIDMVFKLSRFKVNMKGRLLTFEVLYEVTRTVVIVHYYQPQSIPPKLVVNTLMEKEGKIVDLSRF